MRKLTSFVPAMILGLGCLLTLKVRDHTEMPIETLETLPAEMMGLSGRDVELSAEELRVGAMTNYYLRRFDRDSAEAFSVYVGYYSSQSRGRTIHSPKHCLPGGGWQTVATGVAPIQVGSEVFRVNRYTLDNGRRRALVYYWYQGRGRVVANEYRMKWNLLRDAALIGRTDEALVRVIVPIDRSTIGSPEAPASEAAGDELALAVAAQLLPAVERVLPPPPRGRSQLRIASPMLMAAAPE